MSLLTIKVVIVDVNDTTIQIMVNPNMVIESGFQTWSAKLACCIKLSYYSLLNKLLTSKPCVPAWDSAWDLPVKELNLLHLRS
jgi:hypothetical protein